MNRRDATLLAAIQGVETRLGAQIQALDSRLNAQIQGLDVRIQGVDDRLDRTNARLDTVIDVLAQLRGDLTAHVITHHHDDD